MFYLYHKVPQNGVKGNVLYPLNILKNIYPYLYQFEVAKYTGREKDMQKVIPVLNCMWNDVLHLSPVSPRDICKELIVAGRKDDFSFTYFKVDPSVIERANAVIYLFSYDNNGAIDNNEIVPYAPELVSKYTQVTSLAKKNYQRQIAAGKKALLYYGLPHILYKGCINIQNIPVATVYSSEFR